MTSTNQHSTLSISPNLPTILLENYKQIKPLEQSKGSLFYAVNIESNLPVILKTFSCFPTLKLSYIQERSYLKRVNHPNIIKMTSYRDDALLRSHNNTKRISYMALEYAAFGDLCDAVINQGPLPVILARMIFHQLIEGVNYLHDNRTAHMDLKAENVVMDENFNVKIIDLDNSTGLETRSFRSRGTPNYRCPEVIKGISENLKACDIYSLGVILFVLISGCYPYHEIESTTNEVRYDDYHRILRRNPQEFWRQQSKGKENAEKIYTEDFKNLITSMLQADPKDRSSMEDVKNSAWFNGPMFDNDEYKREMKKYLNVN